MQLYSWIISGLLASISVATTPETYDYVSLFFLHFQHIYLATANDYR